MVTKRDLEVAIAAYGLGRVIPAGATRAAIRKAIPALVRGGVAVAPPAAQTLGTLAAACLLYTSPSPRDYAASRMPSSA